MENYEYSGKTVEDAITRACVELGVTSDEITYDVVEKGSKGLFNLGSKDAVIRLTSLKGEPCGEPAPAPEAPEAPAAPEAAPAPEAPVAAEAPEAPEAPEAKEPEEAHEEHHHHEPTGPSDPAVVGIAEAFLKDVFDAMKLEVTMNSTLDAENNVLSIDLSGPEMGIIIGKRGQTLDSLQYITSLAVNRKTSPYTRIKIDTEDRPRVHEPLRAPHHPLRPAGQPLRGDPQRRGRALPACGCDPQEELNFVSQVFSVRDVRAFSHISYIFIDS